MSAATLLVGFLAAPLVWQLNADLAGRPIALWVYRARVQRAQSQGLRFPNREAMTAWADQTSMQSYNMALLGLPTACGFTAGVLGFPLFKISRSTNGWGWARIAAMGLTSWIALSMFHPWVM